MIIAGKYGIKVNWPWYLTEHAILDLAIQGRQANEKLAIWLEEDRTFVVLFDGKPWQDIDSYSFDDVGVAPDTFLIFDYLQQGRSMAGADVAGIRIESLDDTLAYFYQAKWQNRYTSRAKHFNKRKKRLDVEFLWTLHTSMTFALRYEEEGSQELLAFFDVYKDIVGDGLKRVPPVHIPLPLNEYQRFSIY